MDWQMPRMDGLEATRIIRSFEAATGRHTMIVAMTANATDEDCVTCIKSGMDRYLSKPVRLKELENVFKDARLPKAA